MMTECIDVGDIDQASPSRPRRASWTHPLILHGQRASAKVRLMESLCALFDHIDLNSEGHISWSEFYSYIVESGLAASSRFTFFKSEFKPAEVVTRPISFRTRLPVPISAYVPRMDFTAHSLVSRQFWLSLLEWTMPATSAPGLGPCHHSSPGLGSPLPHRRRDSAHRCHACTKTGLTATASVPGLGSPLPHRRRDWGRSS